MQMQFSLNLNYTYRSYHWSDRKAYLKAEKIYYTPKTDKNPLKVGGRLIDTMDLIDLIWTKIWFWQSGIVFQGTWVTNHIRFGDFANLRYNQ